MNARIRDTDNGYKALLARLLKASKGTTLTVGVHEAEGAEIDEGGDATVLDVATFNEFGTESIPRRSFIADWADENADQHREMIRKSMAAVAKGQLPSVEVALERLGLQFVGEVQRRIKAGISPDNAPETIAAKGSSLPLVDSGQLFTSITSQVTDGKSTA